MISTELPMPDAARAVYEHEKVVTIASQFADFDGVDFASLAADVRAAAQQALPLYSRVKQPLATALESGTGSCLHRAMLVEAVSWHIPNVTSAILAYRKSTGAHVSNVITSASKPSAVVVENGKDDKIQGEVAGTFTPFVLDLTTNQQTDLENYVVARTLLGQQAVQSGIVKHLVYFDAGYNSRVVNMASALELPSRVYPVYQFVGGAALEFVARNALRTR